MERSSIIATVAAAGGVLVAASVASFAVINAASTSEPQADTVTLVAEQSPAPVAVAPVAGAQVAEPTPAAVDLPPVQASTLPPVPTIAEPSPATSTPPSDGTRQSAKAPAPQAAQKSKPKTAGEPKKAKPLKAQVEQVSAEQAVRIVLNASGGGLATGVAASSHGGYDAWGVRVRRDDGSVVTGFVDRTSGVIYDWRVDKDASSSDSSDDEDGYSDDEHGDEYDNEYEGESDDD